MAKKPAAKKSPAKAENLAAVDDPDFVLHSLQDEFDKNKLYDANEEQMLHFYEQMLLIRRFEERAGQLYGLGLIGGISKGKGGSMHMFSTEHKFYGGHGIVGAQVPLGAGLAFAHKYNEDGGICLAYFGDGAANQGQVYEAFNMAALWNLPICFVVEDNQYAMGTATKRSSAETRFYRRGTSFRIPGMEVDGMNVLEVRQAAEVAFKHIREGNGPVLMECNTYRYRGHSMSDPAKYRTREEVQDQKEHHDPIERIKKALIEQGKSEDELKEIDKGIRSQVSEAADFAENSPEPEAAELYTDVLVGEY